MSQVLLGPIARPKDLLSRWGVALNGMGTSAWLSTANPLHYYLIYSNMNGC